MRCSRAKGDIPRSVKREIDGREILERDTDLNTTKHHHGKEQLRSNFPVTGCILSDSKFQASKSERLVLEGVDRASGRVARW